MNETIQEILLRFRSLTSRQQTAVLRQMEEMTVRDSNMLTAKEVADQLRVSLRTLYYHLKYGPPPGSQGGDLRLIPKIRVGRQHLWHKDDVKNFLLGYMEEK